MLTRTRHSDSRWGLLKQRAGARHACRVCVQGPPPPESGRALGANCGCSSWGTQRPPESGRAPVLARQVLPPCTVGGGAVPGGWGKCCHIQEGGRRGVACHPPTLSQRERLLYDADLMCRGPCASAQGGPAPQELAHIARPAAAGGAARRGGGTRTHTRTQTPAQTGCQGCSRHHQRPQAALHRPQQHACSGQLPPGGWRGSPLAAENVDQVLQLVLNTDLQGWSSREEAGG